VRYLSVCSGIEAATVAWHPLGWQPVGFSEIEPFPSAVLAHHYPNVPNYGDMTKHKEWPLGPGTIDLLVGGTPCQSFSVAGLRRGLSDPRGGLMLTYLEIAQRLRPRWVVWENVPGVLSSAGGRDFGSFLGALGELGYGWAYRVLDAQWVRTHKHPRAVPQRRRRVFVVGRLIERGAGDWAAAAKVLLESESVQRDSPKKRKATEVAPADAEGGAGSGGWMPNNPGVVSSVCTKWSKGTGGPSGSEHFNLVTQPTTVAVGFNWQNGGGYGKANDGLGITVEGTGPLQRCNTPAVAQSMTVRRLTPRECERLQGFPDDYTLIPWRKKTAEDCPDGLRYKALGNSMAVNCMAWIGERIAAYEARTLPPARKAGDDDDA
jgi:DNA (cytosine-5)-methyltransferase 1